MSENFLKFTLIRVMLAFPNLKEMTCYEEGNRKGFNTLVVVQHHNTDAQETFKTSIAQVKAGKRAKVFVKNRDSWEEGERNYPFINELGESGYTFRANNYSQNPDGIPVYDSQKNLVTDPGILDGITGTGAIANVRIAAGLTAKGGGNARRLTVYFALRAVQIIEGAPRNTNQDDDAFPIIEDGYVAPDGSIKKDDVPF